MILYGKWLGIRIENRNIQDWVQRKTTQNDKETYNNRYTVLTIVPFKFF